MDRRIHDIPLIMLPAPPLITADSLSVFLSTSIPHIPIPPPAPSSPYPKNPVPSYIDHTVLAATATSSDVSKLVSVALTHRFAAICINSVWVPHAASLLQKAKEENAEFFPFLCAVVGFPLGANATETKLQETKWCIENGKGFIKEIDMVINLGWLGEENYWACFDEIRQLALLCHEHNVTLKVILETAVLKPEKIAIASCISLLAGADFIKTSTGFNAAGGASVEAVRIMKWCCENVGEGKGRVKASGGIRTYEDFEKMREAGADRVGASASIKIMEGQK
ncbi:deoxyribose-phosphate aldolase [Atractiella rhizophila]|nr:deoxyribose-phosphate aldolase [Atractiella rhizophila]